MRKIGYILVVIAFLSGCASSKKLLEKGEYDKAIVKSAHALQKNPNDTKQFQILKQAYKRANLLNSERIDFLKKENRKDNSFEIYHLYTLMNGRQNIVLTLPDKLSRQFKRVNYNEDIVTSKKTAADNFYQQGLQYLNEGGRKNARKAYGQFVNAKKIYSNYKNVNQLMNEAHFEGTNFILFRIKNNSNKIMPGKVINEIKKISLQGLNTFWLTYDTYPDSTINYDYYIVLNINKIMISPQRIEKKYYTDIRKIQDGMKYVLDANGNVKRDSSGNDIKVPNMVNVHANIVETLQSEDAFIGGTLDYVNLRTNQLVKTNPISANFSFEHFSASYRGNRHALSAKDRKIVRNRPVPFPPDNIMLLNTSQILKNQAKNIIYNNRNLFLN